MSIALIVCIVGGLIYLVFKTGGSRWTDDIAELGRLAFVAGLLAYLLKG